MLLLLLLGAEDIMDAGPIGEDEDEEDEEDDDDQRLLLSLSADSTKWISPVMMFMGFTSKGYMTRPPVNTAGDSSVSAEHGAGAGVVLVVMATPDVAPPALCCSCSGEEGDGSSLILGKNNDV